MPLQMTCDECMFWAFNWMNRRIKEMFYLAHFHPELNKHVQSFDLTLFPMGTGITLRTKA